MLDPGMVTWARVVLLQDRTRPYERVQAYRILISVNPQVYRPRLARALGDLVDGFSPAAPAEACRRLLAEAATALRLWAAAMSDQDLHEVTTGGRNRRAADDEGPDWDLLAASVALSNAGRGDAALALAEELVSTQRRRVPGSPAAATRLAIALHHQATLLEYRSRSKAAADLRTEAAAAAARGRAGHRRSDAIAEMLTAGLTRPSPGKRSMTAPGAAPSRSPMPMR